MRISVCWEKITQKANSHFEGTLQPPYSSIFCAYAFIYIKLEINDQSTHMQGTKWIQGFWSLLNFVRKTPCCPAVQQHHLICQQYHVHTPGRYCGPELRVWHTRCFVFWTTNHTPNHTTPCISLLPTLNNIVSNQSSVEQPLYQLQQPSLIRQPATDQLQHPGRLDPQVFSSAPCYRGLSWTTPPLSVPGYQTLLKLFSFPSLPRFHCRPPLPLPWRLLTTHTWSKYSRKRFLFIFQTA